MLTSLALIPDGNRRYMEKTKVSLEQSYIKGFDKAEEVLNWCMKIPTLKNIVFYALSLENLQRDKLQLAVLFELYKQYLKKLANSKEIIENQVRVRVVGDKIQIKELDKEVKEVEEKTKNYTQKNLYIAFAYSSQNEMFDAVKKSRTKEDVIKNLEIPVNIDLLIRTSGRQRLSNFLLWQAAYSEIYFVDHLWPEFTKADFDSAINFYNNTQRNLGK